MNKEWKSSKVKYIFSIINGSTPSSFIENYWDGNIVWVTPEDINLKEKYIFNSKKKITEEGYKNCGTTIIPKDSLVLTTRAPVGNIAISGLPLCTNQGCKSLVLKDKAVINYFYYKLLSMNKELNSISSGSTFIELSTDKLSSLTIPLPPLQTQKTIANFLDKETARIDKLIQSKEKLISLLEEKKQSMISQVVTRGLDPKVKLKDSGIPWIGKIPKHWEVEKARWLFTQSHIQVSDNDEIVTCFRNGRVTLRKNVREEGFTNAIKELGYQGIQKGQLVLHSMDAFAGAIGVSDSNGKCSPEYIICDPIKKSILNDYYAFIIRKMALNGFIQASCPAVRERAPRIRFSNFKDMLLPLPPRKEQKEIVEYLKKFITQTNNIISKTQESIELLKERRTAIISEAVTGKLKL
ncbi:MAG: restriction endonuclease subunit S [Leptospiraceae bacterium]|nr:restriction endonuclease subunit S [Leptospiraceae bacterium]